MANFFSIYEQFSGALINLKKLRSRKILNKLSLISKDIIKLVFAVLKFCLL